MANICEYKVIVKGAMNACYAFFGSMPAYENEIVCEFGTDDDYTLHFEGNCKWNVDAYCDTPWTDPVPVQLPEDKHEAMALAQEKYANYTVRDRSRMFGVAVFCNSADTDAGSGDLFECYYCGKELDFECPDELSIMGSEEDTSACCNCGEYCHDYADHTTDGRQLCYNCYDEGYAFCYECEQLVHEDHYHDVGDGEVMILCDECFQKRENG